MMNKKDFEALVGTEVVELNDQYMVNMFGKYQPNITFLVDKEVNLDGHGDPINPLAYFEDKEIEAAIGLKIDGKVSFMFGKAWRSKKGGMCFTPKTSDKADSVLINVYWGGAFSRTCGFEKAPNGAMYYRKAKSNAGRQGHDYVIFPLYKLSKEFVQKHAKFAKDTAEHNEAKLEAKAAAEKESANTKAMYMPRLLEIKERLAQIGKTVSVRAVEFLDDKFIMEYEEHLYNDAGLKFAEETLKEYEDFYNEVLEEMDEEASAKKFFAEAKTKFEAFGFIVKLDDYTCVVKDPRKANTRRETFGIYRFNKADVERGIIDLKNLE